VALALGHDARSALASWRESAVSGHPGLRPVADEALHATLCFLGTCPLADLDAIAAACAIGCEETISGLSLGAAMWLPRRRPRVLAVALEDATGTLARVQSALAAALHAGGWYRPEARPFLGHVTVARVAKGERGHEVPAPPRVSLAGTEAVTIYRSHLSPKGSRYEALRTVRVDGGEAPGRGPVV
jgi:2'-5' RNA ligase